MISPDLVHLPSIPLLLVAELEPRVSYTLISESDAKLFKN